MSTYIIKNSDISHAGIKGMRWGVRRYQNPDGTLTEDGKKRYLQATKTITQETGNMARTSSAAIKNTRVKAKRMDLSKMTDKEMRDRIAREQLESQYDSMFNTDRHKAESRKQTVTAILEGIGTAATVTTSALAIALAVKQLKSSS